MKYICDVSGDAIPENKNVKIEFTPCDDTGFIDIKEERKDIRLKIMVHEDIARILVNLINCNELGTVLAVWPPNNKGLLEALTTPFNSSLEPVKHSLDDPNDHQGHRFPVENCETCKFEQYDDVKSYEEAI